MDKIKARRIYPQLVKSQQLRCSGDVLNVSKDYRRTDSPKCQKFASFEINGENYCATHAGRIALEALIDG